MNRKSKNREDNIVFYIPCVPCWIAPAPPNDAGQSGNKKEECPNCGKKMWTTDRKRKKKKEFPEAIMLCTKCVVNDVKFKEEDLSKYEIIDLAKIN